MPFSHFTVPEVTFSKIAPLYDWMSLKNPNIQRNTPFSWQIWQTVSRGRRVSQSLNYVSHC